MVDWNVNLGHRTERANMLLTRLAEKYGQPIGRGLYRIVFKTSRGVLKFPTNEAGEMCNEGESARCHENYARGRYLEIGGFVCLMQEWVEPATMEEIRRVQTVPTWVDTIDCQQVGYTKNGSLKAYDFVHP